MGNTKISIIVPSYNQGRFLEDTLQSIIDQHYDDVEIIVMDGGSTDNSVEVIKKFEKHIAYWQSKKDAGQSKAINNGFKKATGEFVTWLNSDDVLLSGVLSHVDETIKKHPNCNFFLGNVVWMDKGGNLIRVGKVEPIHPFFAKRHLFSNGGPSAFMRKSVLESIGMLREDFHYMMDTELWHRLIATGHLPVRINSYIWGLRLHEDAKMSGHNFANSKLSDKSHPSWIQKKKESDFLSSAYPIDSNTFKHRIWRSFKLLQLSFYTRFWDRHLIGHHYSQISLSKSI